MSILTKYKYRLKHKTGVTYPEDFKTTANINIATTAPTEMGGGEYSSDVTYETTYLKYVGNQLSDPYKLGIYGYVATPMLGNSLRDFHNCLSPHFTKTIAGRTCYAVAYVCGYGDRPGCFGFIPKANAVLYGTSSHNTTGDPECKIGAAVLDGNSWIPYCLNYGTASVPLIQYLHLSHQYLPNQSNKRLYTSFFYGTGNTNNGDGSPGYTPINQPHSVTNNFTFDTTGSTWSAFGSTFYNQNSLISNITSHFSGDRQIEGVLHTLRKFKQRGYDSVFVELGKGTGNYNYGCILYSTNPLYTGNSYPTTLKTSGVASMPSVHWNFNRKSSYDGVYWTNGGYPQSELTV